MKKRTEWVVTHSVRCNPFCSFLINAMLTVETKKKPGPLNGALKDVKCEQTLIVIVCETNSFVHTYTSSVTTVTTSRFFCTILLVELLSFSHLFVAAETEKKLQK